MQTVIGGLNQREKDMKLLDSKGEWTLLGCANTMVLESPKMCQPYKAMKVPVDIFWSLGFEIWNQATLKGLL